MPAPTVEFAFHGKTIDPTAKRLIRTSDGDTPVIEQSVRMVSCDTPEKAGYAGGSSISQPKLDTCRQRLESQWYPAIPSGLIGYLLGKLTPDAADRHIRAAMDASAEFERLLNERLQKPDGTMRKVAAMPTGQLLDSYSRLLAYLAPWYSGSASDPLPPKNDPRRNTFNLNMIASGWAAFFPIYPSLPKTQDFKKAIEAAESAWDGRFGAWERYGENLLLAYEYRMCIKLGTAKDSQDGMEKAFQRVCVDLRDASIKGKFGFYEVPPPFRLWIWQQDLEQARVDLGLLG